MSSNNSPAEMNDTPRPPAGTWVRLFCGVLAAGCSLGAFLFLSAQTETNTPYLTELNQSWMEAYTRIPVVGVLLGALVRISQPRLLFLLPSLITGGMGILVLWWILSLAAAWQNSVLFPRALKQVGWCLAVLLFYAPLCLAATLSGSWLWQWCAVAPFAVSACLVTGVFRTLREESLGGIHFSKGPTEKHNPLAITIVWAVSMAAFLIWAWLSLLRHNNFHSHAYNMALISHALSRFVTGEGMATSLNVLHNGPLVYPFSPILFLLSPLYFFGPHPETLLLIQAAAVAFAAIPLFFFGRLYLNNSWAACALALCYLLLPGLTEGILSDFSALSLAPFLFFWFVWETIRPHSRRWWLPFLLVCMVGETLFIYTLAWGIFLVIRTAAGRFQTPRITVFLKASVIVMLSLLYPYLVYGLAQPTLYPEATAETHLVEKYKDFIPEWMDPSRKSIPGLVHEIAVNPLISLSLIFDPKRLEVFLRFWGGVFFLPLWNLLAWVPLLPAFQNTLSSEEYLFTWAGPNCFGPVMAISVATVISLGLLKRWHLSGTWVTPLSWIMLFSSVVWWIGDATLRNPGPPPWVRFAVAMAPEDSSRVLGATLPLGKSVSAQSHLLPHLTHESQLFLLPPSTPVPVAGVPDGAPEFEHLQPAAGWPDLLILDRNTKSPQSWYNLWFYDQAKVLLWLDWLVQSGHYRPSILEGPLEIYERSGTKP